MRKLLFNIIILAAFTLASLYVVQSTLFKSIWFKKVLNYFGTELYRSYQRAEETYANTIKIIVLGDSSGKQQFGENLNQNTVSLTCNQATTMVGHFILLETFFENNPSQKGGNVYLIYHPASFSNNMDQKYTYHYLLKPFYTKANKKYFNKMADSIARSIPYSAFCQFPLIKMTKWSPVYGMNTEDSDEPFLSEISIEYLKKIEKICQEHHYTFKVVAPLMNSNYESDMLFQELKSQIAENNLNNEFKDYFNNMKYLPDSLFVDPVHLKSYYVNSVLKKTNFQNGLIDNTLN